MPRRNSGYRHGPGALLVFLYSVLATNLSRPVAATSLASNVTIDDARSSGRFYTPPLASSTVPPSSNETVPRWVNQACSGCSRKPDLKQLQNGTFTELYLPAGNNFTYDISFGFNGTAIYVYLFLSDQAPTTCEFVLDDNHTSYTEKTQDPYAYNVLAFSKTGLDLGEHNLTIKASGIPDTANYLGFDYANFTRPGSPYPSYISNTTSIPLPSPSSNPSTNGGNGHETVKAIVGGVVGGFLAILALFLAASFYRNRRLRELEKAADPFLAAHPALPADQRRLIPPPRPEALRANHTRLDSQTAPRSTAFPAGSYNTRPHPFPLPADRTPPNVETEARRQVRQQRQREIQDRLQNAKTQLRTLESSYTQDQRRLQTELRRGAQEDGRGRVEGHHDTDNPVIRLVPGGMPDPVTGHTGRGAPGRQNTTGEPMVNPDVLGDMRVQMELMMDQIQFLRTQQNSPYAQGLTDEPPPGYAQVINWDQLR